MQENLWNCEPEAPHDILDNSLSNLWNKRSEKEKILFLIEKFCWYIKDESFIDKKIPEIGNDDMNSIEIDKLKLIKYEFQKKAMESMQMYNPNKKLC